MFLLVLAIDKARSAYALASVVALVFFLTVVLGVAVSHVDYSQGVTEAYVSRSIARSALVSMTNFSLKWLAAEVGDGDRPRAYAVTAGDYLTDFDSLRIFASIDMEGCEVRVYDLDYETGKIVEHGDEERVFPPNLPGGYMIRAVAEKKGLAPLTLESVYVVTSNLVPEAGIVEILDDKPLYWRELFRK
jgi:hypothetical protein